MTEFVNVRASKILGQDDLVEFLKARFGTDKKRVGRTVAGGTECVDVRVRAGSREFEEIRECIDSGRRHAVSAYSDFTIGWYLRRYSKAELERAEVLLLKISSHFEPAGEECGTLYRTLCQHCNWGTQVSDLALDLGRVPQHRALSETIAWVEWVVSSELVQVFRDRGVTGAKFRPILDSRRPLERSKNWFQLQVEGRAGVLGEATRIGRDPFSPSEVVWRCPLGHAVAGQFLSEVHLHRREWDASDITVTTSLFGQGCNLLRPTPLIIISQRAYQALQEVGIKGLAFEVAHLV
jgi:hypothetical protein